MSAVAVVATLMALPTVEPPASAVSLWSGSRNLAPPDTIQHPVGREAVETLEIPPLVFDPPEAEEHEVMGVPVFHLHDPALPLVDVHIHVQGGPGHFDRDFYGAASALPSLLRTGGTETLPPDTVEARMDLLALQVGTQRGGGGTTIRLNALTERVHEGLDLVGDFLVEPGFDEDALEVWRRSELERIRRREDDPTSLAYAEFNRLLFGDHPVGWVREEEDLEPDRLSEANLRKLHATLFCRGRVTLGISGDISWEDAEPLARGFLERWSDCPAPLREAPTPELRPGGDVFVLPREVEQSTIIVAGPGGVRQDATPEYYASRIGNHVLGGGGLGSRLSARVRSEEGLAYWASSLWTTPARYEGLVGAVTATRAESTVRTVEVILEVLETFRNEPPDPHEVDHAIEQIANGFVFAFESAPQIVARRISHRIQDLPADWLERYIEAIQEVDPEAVHQVASEHIALEEMTILVVGDPDRFEPGLQSLGSVYELHPDGSYEPWVSRASEPRGSPRSPP